MRGTELTRLPADDVWDEVDQAASAWEALRARGFELDFARSGESGRIAISLCDLGGNVLRTLRPADAIALASGA